MAGSLYGFVKCRLTNQKEKDLFSSQNEIVFDQKRQKDQKDENGKRFSVHS
jgi:hypothetical protein